MRAAKDQSFFKNKGIKAVVNATPDVPHYFANDEIEYMRINLNDSLKDEDFAKMLRYFPHAVSFIHKNLVIDNVPTLVHCHAGIQRSAGIVAAYLMMMKRVSLEQSIKYIMSRRPIAFFGGRSVNFLPSLKKFAEKNGLEIQSSSNKREHFQQSQPHGGGGKKKRYIKLI